MSKIAQYLNEHLLGSVTAATTVRAQYATDGSVLSLAPEIVAFPKVTNDIRKIARFSWQLAEKGHVIGLTVRGNGGDTTGGAIGTGIMIDTAAYLNETLYVAVKEKQKFVQVQPGVSLRGLLQTLKWHGLTLGGYQALQGDMTIGGAIATNAAGPATGKYRTIGDAVERLEVILANGDVIETSRISRKELDRKKGEQTLEGEIYRQVDGIIEDNQEVINTISSEGDAIGYRIDQVKQKDGSFDLTPLFIGSQGTLGIISEAVLGLNFFSDSESALVAVFTSQEQARDYVDQVQSLDPAILQVIDAGFFEVARTRGKRFVIDDADDGIQSVVYVSFDDISDKAQERKLKRALKFLAKTGVKTYSSDDVRLDDLRAVRDVTHTVTVPARADDTRVAIIDGARVPRERQEEFTRAVGLLAEKHHLDIPLSIDGLSGQVTALPVLHLKRVGDKQKVFKLAADYTALVHAAGGTISGQTAEGRLHSFTAYPHIDSAVIGVYQKIRKAFDPFGTLNPGVKQAVDIKVLARQLRSEV